MTVIKTGALESCSDGGTSGRTLRRKTNAGNSSTVAATGASHTVTPGKSLGRCGKCPNRTMDGVVRSGQSWAGKWVQPCKGGQEAGNAAGYYLLATGFSHLESALTRLFPHKSTQVVDFPHLANVRLFSGGHEIRFKAKRRLEPIWGWENHGDTEALRTWHSQLALPRPLDAAPIQ